MIGLERDGCLQDKRPGGFHLNRFELCEPADRVGKVGVSSVSFQIHPQLRGSSELPSRLPICQGDLGPVL